ncbi:MAG: nicotinate (nicotinamide) nucleotide adenylyltransferase [Oscillospiraceae bacterium]|nr:nicotinate (nicotinamide) nucleotide adenylyltransferase [Oscillospiraceae bacterium]
MKIGVFGGTFNPPHLGHVGAARFALDALGLDKLLLVPAAQPPHKALSEDVPRAAQRRALVEQAADAMLDSRIEVCTLELKRAGPSYTSDTLRALRAQYPDATLWLLLGEDMFFTLQGWHASEEIMAQAGICAFARTAETTEAYMRAQAELLTREYGARVEYIAPPVLPISSTALRALLREGGGREYLQEKVYGAILMAGLYGTHADLRALSLPDLRACAYSMMRAKRTAHVKGTEETAVKLAVRWGADTEQAARAAILHDCTKYDDRETQLYLCEKYGIVLDEVERKEEKLLHAKTGAAVARDLFGVSDEAYSAIFWHTTAKADMTTLEKILYVADYMEPNRAFDGVEELRRLAFTDLDAAVLRGCEMSVEEMAERGRVIHPKTLQAKAWLAKEKGT